MSAQVCSFVEASEGVSLGDTEGVGAAGGGGEPATTIPSREQAARSIAAFWGPLVMRSRRFGSAPSTSAGRGVRSRMTAMRAKGRRRAIRAVVWEGEEGSRVVGKEVLFRRGARCAKRGAAAFW